MNEKIDYNELPVLCCKEHLHLSIKCDDATSAAEEGKLTDEYRYCEKCGSVNIISLPFKEWEAKYEEKYGLKYLEDN